MKRFWKKKTFFWIGMAVVILAGTAVFTWLSGAFNHEVAALPVAVSSSSVLSSSVPRQPMKATNIAEAKAVNPDTVGWLTVPGTTLDLAVVHTNNNDFYLKHNLKKEYYKKGWPFLDYRDNPNPDSFSRNTVIYGHNMGDGTLFGQLKKYKDLSFLNANPVLYYGTENADCYWKIFSVYITDVNLYYIRTDFLSDEDFAGFVKQMQGQSLFNSSVDVTAQDKILTLSTCTYEFTNARFVVQARLVRKGEDLSVPPASANPSPASPHHAPSK